MLNASFLLDSSCCFPAARSCLWHSQTLCCARFQGTERARSEHVPHQGPRNVDRRQKDRLHSTLEAGSGSSASPGARPHQQMQQPSTRVESGVSERSSSAASSQRMLLESRDAQYACSNQSSGLLYGASGAAGGNTADTAWRREALSTSDSQTARCAEQLDLQSAVEVISNTLQSRSWPPGTASESTLLHEFDSSANAKIHCASQAGEAIGEYIMYRF